MKKNSKFLILIVGLLLISLCINLSIGSQVYASKIRPKGMAITAKGWGMKSINVFMDKRRAIKYSSGAKFNFGYNSVRNEQTFKLKNLSN